MSKELVPAGRWLAARHLRVGDRLLLKLSERATVSQVTLRLEKLHVHNLTVLRVHNYAVGVGGVVVHNTSAQTLCSQIHHLATHYGAWGDRFRTLFSKAGMDVKKAAEAALEKELDKIKKDLLKNPRLPYKDGGLRK